MDNTMQNAKVTAKAIYKVTGRRPFDGNQMSINVLAADSADDAKAKVIKSYGYRGADDDDPGKPNIVIDEVQLLPKA